MHKHPSCSFNSSFSNINRLQISAREESILNQYNRLKENQQTPQYSIETLPYLELPKFASPQISSCFSQCIYLHQFTFYQMFTMLIAEYLFKGSSSEKAHKINHLKSLIYSAQFLEGSLYTKGLLVKGFKLLQQMSHLEQYTHPIGQSLLNSDSICAFTECWKQLIARICKQNKIPVMTQSEIDSSIFELFASYFHVNFNVYWKEKGNRLWKQHFTFQKANSSTQTLGVIVNPQYQISVSQRSIKVTQSRASGNSSNNKTNTPWNYIILTNPHQQSVQNFSNHQICQIQREMPIQNKIKLSQKAELPNGEQISRISEVDYSCGQTQQIKILLEDKGSYGHTVKKSKKMKNEEPCMYIDQSLSSILNTMSKANWLIEQMRKYSEQLEKMQLPSHAQIMPKRI